MKPMPDIRKIRDLKLVYLYEVPYAQHAKSYYGMKVVYGNNQVVQMTHRDPKFMDFVTRVFDMYQLERGQERYITVVGEHTQKFLADMRYVKGNNLIHMPNKVGNVTEKYPLDDAFEGQILWPFLSWFLHRTTPFLDSESNQHRYTMQNGYKARKSLVFTLDGTDRYVPLKIVPENQNSYEISMLYSSSDYFNIKAHLHLKADGVQIAFSLDGALIHGELEFGLHYPNGGLSLLEEVKIYNGEQLLSERMDTLTLKDADVQECRLVNDYLLLADVAFDCAQTKVYKIAEGIYFVDDLLLDEKDKEDIVTDINALVVATKETVAIKYTAQKYTYRQVDALKQILDFADVDIVFQLIHTPPKDSDYIVCQKKYNDSAYANAEYRQSLANQYADTVFRAPEGYDLCKGAAALKEIPNPVGYRKRKYRFV